MSHYTITAVDVIFATAALLLLLVIWLTGKRRIPGGLRLPPGPQGKLIIGNLGDMPEHYYWETCTKWYKEYGDLVYIHVFGQGTMFVNSIDAARDLFEKRSSLYSDRHQLTMVGELAGFDWALSIMPYGERWRKHRRIFHQYFHPKAVVAYHGIQVKHTRIMLQQFHKSHEDFVMHIRQSAGAIIMEIIYGIKVLPMGDPYVELAEKVQEAAAEAVNPGRFLVDTLPILKYVPEWMPGAGFQKTARTWRVLGTTQAALPFAAVKQALSAGTARPSFVASLLEELSSMEDPPPDREDVICYTAGQAYGAAVDTTASELQSFLLAMVLYPDVQRKAQAELDSVIGMGRLPTFGDRPHLHYINALCKEVHRWHPVLPLGLSHKLTQDDVYGRNFIPAGTIVVGNTWAMLHDEKMYGPQPDEFIPERFLKPGVEDPTVAFGFGRRVCPGRHMAENSTFIAFASILKVFDISSAKDCNGNEIPVKPLITSGFLSHPEPFKCQIKPRSASAESLIWEHVDD